MSAGPYPRRARAAELSTLRGSVPQGPPTVDASDPWLAARLPRVGRVHWGSARVRLADARPGRRCRLDALARYLQDVAEEDAATSGLPATIGWMLRRTRFTVERFPSLGEELTLATFCSATGARWAERTTLVVGDRGAQVVGVAIWVALDLASGSPARLDDRFFAVYGPSAEGRRASLRLQLSGPGPEPGNRRSWPLRRADLDVWGHANNAVAWAAVEEALPEHPSVPLWALVEHPQALLPTSTPELVVDPGPDGQGIWLVGDGTAEVLVAARVQPASPVAEDRPTYGIQLPGS
jgi:acyl-ACP thioesterase